MIRATVRRRGFTLLEMLSVMAMFAVGMAVLTASLGLLMRLRSQEDRHDDQLSELHLVAKSFRDDIHAGIAYPEAIADLKSSPQFLLVELPRERMVAWKSGDGGLARAEFKKGEKPKWVPQLERLRKPQGAFTREGALVRLEVTDQHRKTAPVAPRLVVEAALAAAAAGRKS